jgi:peptidoglycan hydrolase-like protein with peptidoglycan-binding domain
LHLAKAGFFNPLLVHCFIGGGDTIQVLKISTKYMQNKSLITGVALSAIAIVGIVTMVNVSNMQKASSAAATAKANLSTAVVDTKPVTEIGSIPPVAPQPKDQPVINYTFTKTLSAGMKGEEVTKLQQVLAENVYYEGEITGVMDKLTVQELKDFQTDNGLTATGTTGPKSRAVLTELSRHLGLCAGGNPAIRVRKPNGGEVYQAGQQINIKWRSCHISHGDNVRVDLVVAPFPPSGTNGVGLGNTINDGQELLTLPQAGVFNGNPMSFGNNFKVFIWHSATGAQDLSNNLFTINHGPVAAPVVVVTAEFPATGTTVTSSLSSGTQIARFKITNNSSVPVTLNNIRLTDAGSHSGTSSTYWLYASDENMNNYTADQIGGRLNSVDFTPLASYPVIHPGLYRYITVVINNTSGIQTGDTFSLGVHATGDINYFVSEQDLGYDANGDGDMIDRISNLATIGNPQLGTVQIN